MLALSEVHGQVVRLNDALVQSTVSERENRQSVREISEQLDSWLRLLPSDLQDTPVRKRHARRGLGREFAVQLLVYHHQLQLLYYQFLHKQPEPPDEGADHEAAGYAARCKTHVTALSQVIWDTNSSPGMECLWSPVNGHLLVVVSSIILYTLLFDKDEGGIKRAKQLLEQNFIMLLQFRKYWSLVELSMARHRAFHRACQLNSTQENFDMDRWMADFLNRYDVHVSERCFDDLPGPGLNDACPDGDNSTGLWLQLPEGILNTSAGSAENPYFV